MSLHRLAAAAALAVTLAAAPASAQEVLVVHAARMLDVVQGEIVSPAVVTIQGDRIQSVGGPPPAPAGCSTWAT
jgi:adenine deaminase